METCPQSEHQRSRFTVVRSFDNQALVRATLLLTTMTFILNGCVSRPSLYDIETYNDTTRLLDSGWQVNTEDRYGNTLICRVASWPNTSEAKRALTLLLSKGADVNSRVCSSGDTPLHCATTVDVMKQLTDAGADINAQNKHGDTPLHCACNMKQIIGLIKQGADPTILNNNGIAALAEHFYPLYKGMQKGVDLVAFLKVTIDDESGYPVLATPQIMDTGSSNILYAAPAGDVLKMLMGGEPTAKARNGMFQLLPGSYTITVTGETIGQMKAGETTYSLLNYGNTNCIFRAGMFYTVMAVGRHKPLAIKEQAFLDSSDVTIPNN